MWVKQRAMFDKLVFVWKASFTLLDRTPSGFLVHIDDVASHIRLCGELHIAQVTRPFPVGTIRSVGLHMDLQVVNTGEVLPAYVATESFCVWMRFLLKTKQTKQHRSHSQSSYFILCTPSP